MSKDPKGVIRVQNYAARQRARGYVCVRIWVPAEREAEIKARAQAMRLGQKKTRPPAVPSCLL